MTSPDRSATTARWLLLLALTLCYAAYRPGLTGSFLFDDFSNLGSLTTLDEHATPQTYLQFLVQGISSPLGRPLSLATFMAQAGDWPDNPAGFIHVNVLLHLANGALLCWWLGVLLRLRGDLAPARHYLPVAATVLWLLAPIQVTSVLYVVQRMTELAATCVFLGMGLYLLGREALLRGAARRGYALMTLGMGFGAGLGTLAKENAAQMPLMVLALEFTLLAGLPRPRGWKLWAAPFLAAPTLLLVAYLGWVGANAYGYASRDFTPAERLLSEARVLFLYLYKIVAPWPTGIRLWYDDYTVSRGLLEPWTTAVALAGLAGLAGAAWTLRTRAPMFAFAVLWFLSCHVLESTALPLELVFDHRNYQAGAGLWLALAAGGAALVQRASTRQARATFTTLIAAYFALQAMVTWQIAGLWGKPEQLTTWMARSLPDSQRATTALLGMLMQHQLPYDVGIVAQRATQRWPETPEFDLTTMTLACQLDDIPFPDVDEVLRKLRTVERKGGVIQALDGFLSLLESRHCPVGMPRPITDFTGAALANGRLRKQRQNLLLMHSRALNLEGRDLEARAVFGEAIAVRPQMILLVQAVLDAVAAKDFVLAHHYLEMARSDPRIRWRERWAYRDDLPQLEALVRDREAANHR